MVASERGGGDDGDLLRHWFRRAPAPAADHHGSALLAIGAAFIPLVIATLGLSTAALPTRYEEACTGEVPERTAAETGRRQGAPATAQERLSYLFWI